jgi:hypothetical protein
MISDFLAFLAQLAKFSVFSFQFSVLASHICPLFGAAAPTEN